MTDDLLHGTDSTYSNHQCRCRACTAAHTAYTKRRRHERAALLVADSTLVEHGKESTYSNWMCRCAACSTAHATYRRVKRQERNAA